MNKSQKQKNVYIFFKAKNFRYISIEAVDDYGNRFLYPFNDGSHEMYLRSAKNMCEQFEKFCKNTCGLYDKRYCDIWTLDSFSPLPDDFECESLFDKPTIGTKDFERSWGIYTDYIKYNLYTLIGKCDYACAQYLSTQYKLKCNHIKTPKSFETFLKKNLHEQNADGVRSAVMIYKKYIDKNNFTANELANIKAYMLKNIDVVFEFFDRRPGITKHTIYCYYALDEAAMRLYEFDKAAFKEIVHKLLDKLYDKFRSANSAVYAFISSFFEHLDVRYHNESFNGILSEHVLPTDFCLAEDVRTIQELIRCEEDCRYIRWDWDQYLGDFAVEN